MSLAERIRTAPRHPGVYRFLAANGEVLYVGKAADLRARLVSYREANLDPWKQDMLRRAVDVDIILTTTEKEAYILESTLIKRHKPRYNVVLTDDKRYPYLKITGDQVPRILVTREVDDDGGHYFGPFPDAGGAWETFRTVRDVFRIRDCKQLPKRACINLAIGVCTGPCEGRVSASRYQEQVKEALRFLKGDAEGVLQRLRRDMLVAAEALEYERAGQARDRIRGIESTLEEQALFSLKMQDHDAVAIAHEGTMLSAVVLPVRGGKTVGREGFLVRSPARPEGELLAEFLARYYAERPGIPPEVLLPHEPDDAKTLEAALAERAGHDVVVRVPARGEKARLVRLAGLNARFRLKEALLKRGEHADLLALGNALGLPGPPAVIHGFDVSHLAGTGVVASRVEFRDGKPAKNGYRRFKIGIDANDDFAAMGEAVRRSYSKDPVPDLILVDGGRGQLGAAVAALAELGLVARVCALAKREEEVFVPGRASPLAIPRDAPALRLLMHVRDEAHRFAVKYQRKKRASSAGASLLDGIPGVGPAKRDALLARFGSLRGVAKATEDELVAVEGVGPKLARTIRSALAGTPP